MKKRTTLFSAMMAALVPVPLFAFDSGVSGMETAETTETEQMSLQEWAFNEFQSLQVGFRSQLEPILPVPKIAFSVLDAEIATFIAEGQREQDRLQEIIDDLTKQEPESAQANEFVQKAEETGASEGTNFFYSPAESNIEMLPEVTVLNNDGLLLGVDTSDGIDLPDLTIDPRNGGQYESEIPLVQNVLDLVQLAQDQVPAPIQTAGNELYNKITGSEGQT